MIAFARNILKSKIFEERHVAPTRQRLRELGHLLSLVQDQIEDQTLQLRQIIDKNYLRMILDIIRAHFLDNNLNQKALQLSYSLEDCGEILEANAIETDNEALEERTGKFLKLFKRLISAEVTSKAKKQKKIVHAIKDKGMIPDDDLSKFLLGLKSDIT